MRIVDEKLLQEFRERSTCELCGKEYRSGLHPHHLSARGMGSGKRMDHRLNLMALCWKCHRKVHDGAYKRGLLLAIVAKRERTTIKRILATINPALNFTTETIAPRRVNVKFHAAAEDFPLLEGDAKEELKKSLRENGFLPQFPIIRLGDLILDGRNRYLLARELKIEPAFQDYAGDTPEAFVFAANINRRHLSLKDRLNIIQKKLPKIRAEREQNKSKGRPPGPPVGSDGTPGETREIVAKSLGVGQTKAAEIIKVLEQGTPELAEAMKDGEVSAADAAAVATEPPKVQREAVKKVRKRKAKTLKKAVEGEPESNGKPMTDELDVEVPGPLVPSFETSKKFSASIRQMHAVHRELKELKELPGGEEFRLQQFEIDWKNAVQTVRFDRPYVVCCVCKGQEKGRKRNCPCNGRGWLNETHYKRLPSEYRQ